MTGPSQHNRGMKTKLLILSVLLLLGCAPIRERVAVRNLRMKFTGVEIARIDLQGVTLNLHWKAYNPNSVNAVLDGFELDLSSNGQKLGHAKSNGQIRIPPHDYGRVVVPLRVRWRDLSKRIQDGIRNKKLSFRAVGYGIMNTPLGKVKFRVVDKTGNIW